jgi:hypothetical protein
VAPQKESRLWCQRPEVTIYLLPPLACQTRVAKKVCCATPSCHRIYNSKIYAKDIGSFCKPDEDAKLAPKKSSRFASLGDDEKLIPKKSGRFANLGNEKRGKCDEERIDEERKLHKALFPHANNWNEPLVYPNAAFKKVNGHPFVCILGSLPDMEAFFANRTPRGYQPEAVNFELQRAQNYHQVLC